MFLENFKIVDLTHLLSPQAPTWNGSCGFCLEIKKDYDRMFRVQQMKMHCGVGTHMDAPSHCIPGGSSIADISLQQLIVPACVIDVSARAHADYEVSVQDIEGYEASYGQIPQNSLVIAYTGWGCFWSQPEAYRNVDGGGQMHFPAFSAQAVEILLKRDIAGIAIDTLSPDCLDQAYPVHKLILGAGKYIIENIANCQQMPPKGGYVIALPLRAEAATEFPIRIVGLFPDRL
jgi:kynurenine formamidase